ncbi:hypothetical protein EVAR_49296_1 [Eumeta japonica]|uniref:Uncharacterized protein n=1 Tax=Eumeta variegata TaxID=151549 RepID=A0A4C1XM01_EUMVA|nr:hypothetical protein EVAR_49296_1 [Eumeta japonica]
MFTKFSNTRNDEDYVPKAYQRYPVPTPLRPSVCQQTVCVADDISGSDVSYEANSDSDTDTDADSVHSSEMSGSITPRSEGCLMEGFAPLGIDSEIET